MPNYLAFGIALFVVGLAAQTFTTSTNSLVQTSTEPHMRGRVIAILLAIALGGTPVGAPIVGCIADSFGPRFALGAGAASGSSRRNRCRLLSREAALSRHECRAGLTCALRSPDQLRHPVMVNKAKSLACNDKN